VLASDSPTVANGPPQLSYAPPWPKPLTTPLLMDCTVWRLWMMRQLNPAQRLPRDLVRPSSGK